MPKAAQMCCVPKCGKTRADSVTLHQFPNPDNEPELFRSWIYAVGGDILALDNQKIFKYRRVCHHHFETRFHTRSSKLSANAVPTLCLAEPSFRRPTLMDITNIKLSVESQIDLQQPTTSKDVGAVEIAEPSTSTQHINKTAITPSDTGYSARLDNVENVPEKNASKTDKTKKKTVTVTDKGSRNSKSRPLSQIFSTEASTLARQIKKLQSAKDNYATKLKKALKLSENETFNKAMQRFTSAAVILILLQFREINKDKMGRRFTKKEKILSLALYKQGPRAYRWLRYIFVLPSPATLSRMITRAGLRPGINENLFQHLKKTASRMSSTDRLCILMFDEIAIAPNFQYNRRRDSIIGFVNNGNTTSMKIADHALVFMIRGIQKKYKQPISYTFCAGSTSKEELVAQIKDVIRKLKSVGFTVLATVCDQGASNMSAINTLIADTKAKHLRQNKEWRNNTFEIDDDEIIPIYDTPHLIKGIRNNLLTKHLTCVIDDRHKTAKWEHVINLYKENPAYQGLRILPNLTENHIEPKKIPKMKVKYATQVFSRSVGISMGYLAEKGILSEECKDTADVIIFFDRLFDSLNGSYENSSKRAGKPLLGPLTPTSCHEKEWEYAKPILKSMKFISNGKSGSVPSIKNFLHTIENIQLLKKKIFTQYELKSIWLRHFNQDPLENFFGCIRSHGGRNVNPTCAGFEVAFVSLLINNMNSLHSPGANCEKDYCETFKSMNKLFFSNTSAPNSSTNEIIYDHLNDDVLLDLTTKLQNQTVKAQLEYVSGYVLRKLKIKNCEQCKLCLFDENKRSEYIRLKDYSKDKKCLAYPSEKLVKSFSNIQDVVTNILRKNCNIFSLSNYIKTVLCVLCDLNFINCSKHKNYVTAELQDISCRLFINSWCNHVNRILKGTQKDFDANDMLQKMAFEYARKRNKQS